MPSGRSSQASKPSPCAALVTTFTPWTGVCPHLGGPLGHGALHGTALVCPWHAWEFDCITGEFDANPDVKLRKFAVKVEEGNILVDAGTA